jgi:hypothetical protein
MIAVTPQAAAQILQSAGAERPVLRLANVAISLS